MADDEHIQHHKPFEPRGIERKDLPELERHWDELPPHLAPDEPVMGPTEIPPKPEIDNTHRDAALSALRAGKPLQRGTQPQR
jgi:hypothetical protein